MKLGLRIGLVFGVSLLVLALIGVASYRSIHQFLETAERARGTQEVLQTIASFSFNVAGAESARRGYFLTNEETYFRQFQEHIENLTASARALHRLTADNPTQQAQLDAIDPLLQQRQANWQLLFDLQKQGKLTKAKQAAVMGQNRELQSEISGRLGLIRAEQEALLQWHRERASAQASRTILLIVLGFALSLLFLGYSGYGIAREFTRRRRTEAQLRGSSRYARSLIEASLDPLVTISADGKIMDVNQATELATGAPREQLLGRDFSDYFTEPEKAREGYRRVFSEGVVTDYPLSIRHKSGRIAHVLYNATVFKNEAGQVQGVFAAARDVTERRRAEEAADAERKRFFDVLEALPAYVVLLTQDYHVPFANRVFRERFGESRGRRCFEFLFGRSEPCEICETFTVLQTKAPHGWEWCGPDGRDYQIFDLPFADTDGSPLILEMGVDITERKRAEQELRKLKGELEQRVAHRTAELTAANKELEAFTYAVAHDLRAPLRHIQGFSNLLREECRAQANENSHRYLERICGSTERMGHLLEDLLNLSRVGRQPLHRQICGLNALVEEVLADLRAEMKDREIEWRIGRLPFVEGDPVLIKQVFSNLISNAVKFTRPRPHAVIEVDQAALQGETVIFVRDNGVGFSMKYADKLFGVFQRLHRQEDFEGTGVGLATVQRITQKHGGRIWAEAELDKGATFFFTLAPCRSQITPVGQPTSEGGVECLTRK
jgi:PAS domain S-box-containing protein